MVRRALVDMLALAEVYERTSTADAKVVGPLAQENLASVAAVLSRIVDELDHVLGGLRLRTKKAGKTSRHVLTLRDLWRRWHLDLLTQLTGLVREASAKKVSTVQLVEAATKAVVGTGCVPPSHAPLLTKVMEGYIGSEGVTLWVRGKGGPQAAARDLLRAVDARSLNQLAALQTMLPAATKGEDAADVLLAALGGYPPTRRALTRYVMVSLGWESAVVEGTLSVCAASKIKKRTPKAHGLPAASLPKAE